MSDKTKNLGLNLSLDSNFDYLDYRYKQLFDENWEIIDSTVFNPLASSVTVQDAGGYFTNKNVESALQQVYAELRTHEGSGGTAHQLVTTTSPGFMDPADKIKLNSISENGINIETGDARYLRQIGGTLTGALTLPGDPTQSLHAATKQYVDSLRSSSDAKFVQVSGSIMNGALTLSGAPTQDLHAASKKYVDDVRAYTDSVKQYVDAVKQSLDYKDSVKVATTANINLGFNSPKLTIDSITTQENDRVLVKNQTNASENGIYVVQNDGSFVRSIDADTSIKVTSGMYVFVEQGTVNGDSGWVLNTDGVIAIGTTALSFTQFSGAGQITAGNGLKKTGSVIELDVTGVTPGTYTSVQVDSTGRVLSASNPTINSANVALSSTNFAATNVKAALDELFTNVSNGKNSIASAITGKGVSASGSDTFAQLSTKIGQIQTSVGTAVAADVLVGKTFSNVSSMGITGTMVNNGAVVINPGTSTQNIASGYHNGAGIVSGDVNLIATNIKSGTSIFGVAGTFSSEPVGTAVTSNDLLSGKNAYVNGNRVSGAMINNGSVTINPSTNNQVIATGYHNGLGVVVGDSNLLSSNIKQGTTIFGVAGSFTFEAAGTAATSSDIATGKNAYVNGAKISGSMTNNGAVTLNPSSVNVTIPAGYHNGSGIVSGDINLAAANIKSGTSIFGVAGTFTSEPAGSAATAGDIVGGKNAYVNGSKVIGSMINIGGVTITPSATSQQIVAGYHNGTGIVNGDVNLAAANIRHGATIFGVAGTFTFEAAGTSATSGDMLNGKNAYVNGAKVSGSMTNNGAITISPGVSSQSIPAGYHNGLGVVNGDVNLVAANIKQGTTIFGVAGSFTFEAAGTAAGAGDVLTGKNAYINGNKISGSMANNGAVTITPGATSKPIAAGYHNGSGTVSGDANLIASNIKSGVNIFGVVGNLANKQFITGTMNIKSGTTVSITGLGFVPTMFIAFQNSDDANSSGMIVVAPKVKLNTASGAKVDCNMSWNTLGETPTQIVESPVVTWTSNGLSFTPSSGNLYDTPCTYFVIE